VRAGLAVGTRQRCPRCRRGVLAYAPIVRHGEERVQQSGPPMLRKHFTRPRQGVLCPGSYTFVGEPGGVR